MSYFLRIYAILAVLIIAGLLLPVASSAQAQTGLPPNLIWKTNTGDPPFGSPEAVRGGILRLSLLSFPLTFRVVGPDSNSSFRSAILDNQLSLIGLHPNTLNIIPELATHWAFGEDGKTMYFRLNPAAHWSDGHPVTAGDFAYTLEFMRSPHIVAPWYNNYYTEEIDRVEIFDDHTLAVVGTRALPDIHLKLGLSPIARHFYGELDETFVRQYNWKVAPNTGPYQIVDFRIGRQITFDRKEDWWGAELPYFQHRFNVDRVIYRVIRDFNLTWEHFKKARLDTFGLTMPQFWHDRTRIDIFEKGYAHRIWFFNDTPQSAMGLWLNQAREIFQDVRVRHAFAHAMNVEKVIERVLRNDFFRLEHGFMGYGPYSNPHIRARRFDIAQVERLMGEAGWQRGPDGIWQKEGLRFSVEVTYGFDGHTPRLVVLREEARKAGIDLRLDLVDAAASYKKVMEKNHDVAWLAWSTSLRPQYWEHFHSVNAHQPQTNNVTNTDDPEMDDLIDAYQNSLDEAERIALSHAIQERIHELGMFVPTFMVPYTREAYWGWWRLPEPPGTRHSGSLFDPFNSTTGGLLWFDADLYETIREARRQGRSLEPVTRIDDTYRIAP